MSSGFPGGVPDFFSGGRRSAVLPTTVSDGTYNTNLNPQQQFSFRSPVAGILSDPAGQIHRPNLIGKRSLAEFQQQNQGLGFYLRNVKPRPNNYQHASPISPLSPVDFSTVPPISPEVSSINPRYGLPIIQQNRLRPLTLSNRNFLNNNVAARAPVSNLGQNKGFVHNTGANNSGPGLEILTEDQSEKNMMMSHKLQELEKELLGDEDDNEAVSVITNSEWSDTIQNLIGPSGKPISPSPTSSSSSCSSTLASPALPCPKQALIDAAAAITDGKPEAAAETLTRLQQQVANARGTSEQRLAAYMVSALKPRVGPTHPHPAVSHEIYDKEHAASTQMLYDVSPCFKLGFMAANLAILEATAEQGFEKIHVLDFDIGQGGQYVHLLHALAAKKKRDNTTSDVPSLKITAFVDIFTGEEKLKIVGDGLKALANRIGVPLIFNVKDLNISDLTRERLETQSDEALAVNFAFRLYKLPDESVTTENLRDEMLRRVKGLSPEVTTVVEQEINTNTAPLFARVRDAWEFYGLLFDSLDATVSRDSAERVRIEEGLGRKIANSVACEGRDRVERCEVFGKWRARMSMAGFQPLPMSRLIVDSLRLKINSGTRGNPGFSVNEESGGICFGWLGRNLTVASAWR